MVISVHDKSLHKYRIVTKSFTKCKLQIVGNKVAVICQSYNSHVLPSSVL